MSTPPRRLTPSLIAARSPAATSSICSASRCPTAPSRLCSRCTATRGTSVTSCISRATCGSAGRVRASARTRTPTAVSRRRRDDTPSCREAGWDNATRYMLTSDYWSADESCRMGVTQQIAPTPAAALDAGHRARAQDRGVRAAIDSGDARVGAPDDRFQLKPMPCRSSRRSTARFIARRTSSKGPRRGRGPAAEYTGK